ncbi:MAG: VWA domain-containing protein [Thermoanaerobaculaceae bacterium]|nr:VWA domain-containing protein [Thermoanaerobaculaceae bacterium]
MPAQRLVSVMSVLLWLAVATVLSAQVATDKPLVETVQVSVVNVEVYVTGRDGTPLRGLKRDDFVLEEDGEEVVITNFYASEAVLAMATPTAGTDKEARELTAPHAALIPEEQGLTVVIFVDSLNTTVRQRRPVLEQLERFVAERLRPTDRTMVVSYDGSLKVRSPLSTDRAGLLAGLQAVGNEVTTADSLHRDRQDILGRMMNPINPNERKLSLVSPQCGTNDAYEPEACQAVQAFAERLYRLNLRLVEALKRSLDALAGVPGRKALVFVSAGIPPFPAEDLFLIGWLRPMRFANLSNDLGDVTVHANAGRVTFYTVNPRGDQELAGLDSGNELSRFLAEHTYQQALIQADQADYSQRQKTLIDFAVGTGGRTLVASPGLGNTLGQLVEDFGAFYSLGFSPSHFGDGSYHNLKVRVLVAGAKVRHREGYFDKTDAQRLADRTAGALLQAPRSNTLSLRAAAEPVRKDRNKLVSTLTVTVPAGELTLVPSADNLGEEGRVTIVITATDREGRTADAHQETFPIKVPTAALPAFLQGSTRYTFDILMRKGPHKVAVTVRDDVALNEGTATLEIDAK